MQLYEAIARHDSMRAAAVKPVVELPVGAPESARALLRALLRQFPPDRIGTAVYARKLLKMAEAEVRAVQALTESCAPHSLGCREWADEAAV